MNDDPVASKTEVATFWRAALVGAPAVLQLGADRRRPKVLSQHIASASLDLPEDVSNLARHIATTVSCNLRDVLLCALTVACFRYSGQDDIVIATPFVRSDGSSVWLPVRCDFSDDPDLAALLGHVVTATRLASEHCEIEHDALIAASMAVPADSHAPIFQVAGWTAHGSLPLARVASPVTAPERAPLDLVVQLVDHEAAMQLNAEFASDLFDDQTVADLLVRLSRIIFAIGDDPNVRASAVPLLRDDEIERSLALARGPERELPDECLHEAIGRHILVTPDAPAVTDHERTLTYTELDAAANDLAHRLRAVALKPRSFVALALPRGVELLIGILAVHRCGCAYVPLEPTYPSDRISFMVSDSGAQYLVTTTALREIVKDFNGVVVMIDNLGEPRAETRTETRAQFGRSAADAAGQTTSAAAQDPSSPDDLAYMIYTSGSTGTPKGVMVQHRGVVGLMREMAVHPGLRPGETMVGITTPAFDLSVPDLFLALTSGAHLVLAQPSVAADPVQLIELLDRVDVDVMQATPATWRMLLDAGWQGSSKLRAVCGGEGYTSALARPLAAKVAELWNFYGPTEATVWCTSALLTNPSDPLPLGTPIAGYEVFVADRMGRPVPHGVAGELLIGGIGLARGYHNRPELTAERFATIDGRRCYRTGDLARTRRDGAFEFLGRIDHQVKLRGFRIELGEIETALAAHPKVREVVVIVREDTPGDQRLVGYVVSDDVTPAELRELIGHRLPSYMVPSIIEVVDDLPRTPNGKTNRAALPIPSRDHVAARYSVAPQGPIEIEIAGMWAEVLGLDSVGANDDFFELGGHSLRITQVLTRIRSAYGVDLDLGEVYANPTVTQTASAVVLAMLHEVESASFLDFFE